jgi:hypothetical protein
MIWSAREAAALSKISGLLPFTKSHDREISAGTFFAVAI